MYASIEGRIAQLTPAGVELVCGGVGYDINISLHTYSQIKDLKECRLFTHLIVREDVMQLYGFSSEEERRLFRLLTTVSGVGANTARLILSSLTPEETVDAIVQGKVATIQKVKGIGAKTAMRIIVDLKDKLGKGGLAAENLNLQHNTTKDEALIALSMLGFSKAVAEKAVDKIIKEEGSSISVEVLIKKSLQVL